MAQAGHGRLYGVLEARGGGARSCGSPGSAESADAGALRPIRSSSVSRTRKGKTSSTAGASASISLVPPSPSQCPGCANFRSKVNSFCQTWAPSPVRSPPGCSSCDKGARRSGSGAAVSSLTDGRWNLHGVWDKPQQVDDGKLLGGPLIGGSVMPLLARGLDGIAMGRVGLGASAWVGAGGLAGKKNNVQKGAQLLHRPKMEKQAQLKGCISGMDPSAASDRCIASWKPNGRTSNDRTSPRGGCGSIGKSTNAANSEKTVNSKKGGQLHGDLVLAPRGHRRAKSDVFGVGSSPVNGACKLVSNEALNIGGAESLLSYVRPHPEVTESQASMGKICGAKGSLKEDEVSDLSSSARCAGDQGVSPCAPAALNCQGESGSSVRIELVGIRSLDSDAKKPNGQQSRAQATNQSVDTPILRVQSAEGNPPAAMGAAHGSSAMMVNGFYPVSGDGGEPLQYFPSEVPNATGNWNAPVANEANGLSISAGEQPSAREAEMLAGTEGDESDTRSGMGVDVPAASQESSQERVEQVVTRSLSEGGSRLMADLLSTGTEDSDVKQAAERNLGMRPESEQEDGKEGSREVTPETLWKELEPYIRYLSKKQLSIVHDALKLAFDAHDGQKRKSGEPYIIHPVAVAQILGGLEMDCETIVAGLLHDTVEDTMMVTFEGIEDQFGTVVRRIVEGETKVSKLGKMQTQNSCDVKADDLRQMFLAMTEEVRVIIVKLADRLHNMRTLSHMPPRKQKHIAEETLQVFAPLAKLLGMYQVKSELEDLAFMYAYPEEYAEVRRRINALAKSQADVVLEAKNVLLGAIKKDKFLDLTTLDAHVVTICKEPYSIFKKLQRRKCVVEEVSDITQLRIVLKMKPAVDDVCNAQQVCYHVLGIIHAMWPPVPGTVKDYIATPKPNGYQSLHTTILPLGSKTLFPLEIQIRTEDMDKLAEWGIAANHSRTGISASQIGYSRVGEHRDQQADEGREEISPSLPENKPMISGTGDIGMLVNHTAKPRGIGIVGADGTFLNDVDIARRVSWLNSIREWQEEFVGNMTAREFVDTIMGDLLGSRVFVFTPEGEVKNLPKGATVIDHAYHIHTDVGNKMIAAKVNGNIVSPTRTLCNAEVVDIITYDGPISKKSLQLHQQWLKYARTRSARHKLTKFLKEHAAMAASEITAEAVDRFVNGEAAIDYADDGDEPITMSGEMFDRSSPEASTSYWTSPSWEMRRSSRKGPESGVDGEMGMVSSAEKSSGRKYSRNYPTRSNMEASTSSFGTNLYEEILTDTVSGKEIGKSSDSGSKGVIVGDGAMRGGNAGGGGGGGGGGVRKLGQRVVEVTGPWALSPSSPSSSRSLSPSSSRSLSPSRSSSPSRATPPSRSKPPSGKFMRRATCTTEGGVHEQLAKSLLGPRNPDDDEARGGLDGYTNADSSRAQLENILENGRKNEGDANGIAGDKGKEMGTKLETKDKLDSHGQSVSELPTDEKGNPGIVNTTREMGFVGEKQLDVASLAVLSVFDAWEMKTVSTWHAEKGRTIVWMSVHYVDRKGLLADVSAIFSKHGIGIHTFSGRTDQKTRVGVMLFELDGPSDMGELCSQVETVPDVLSWVMGCTWQYPNYLLLKDRAAGT